MMRGISVSGDLRSQRKDFGMVLTPDPVIGAAWLLVLSLLVILMLTEA